MVIQAVLRGIRHCPDILTGTSTIVSFTRSPLETSGRPLKTPQTNFEFVFPSSGIYPHIGSRESGWETYGFDLVWAPSRNLRIEEFPGTVTRPVRPHHIATGKSVRARRDNNVGSDDIWRRALGKRIPSTVD